MQHEQNQASAATLTAISKMIFSGGGGGGILLPPAGEAIAPEDPKKRNTGSCETAGKGMAAGRQLRRMDGETADKILEKALEESNYCKCGCGRQNRQAVEIASGNSLRRIRTVLHLSNVTLDKAAVDALASQAGTTGKGKNLVR